MRYYYCKRGDIWRDNAIIILDLESERIVSVILKNPTDLEPQKIVEEDCTKEDICSYEYELEVVPL